MQDYSMATHTPQMFSEYQVKKESLVKLYGKAKKGQWNAQTDLDWQFHVDPDNPLQMHDEVKHIIETPIWRKMNKKQQGELRRNVQCWKLSQILHGEQAALLCATKIAQLAPTLEIRLCASLQAVDEARHMEAYARLLNTHFDQIFELSPHFKKLLEQILSESRCDMIELGMNVLVEGVALSMFRRMHAYSSLPFMRQLMRYITLDEARHCASGRLSLQDVAPEYTDSERREREEFICTAVYQIHQYMFADEVWESVGLSRNECAEFVHNSPTAMQVHRSLFRQLVPTVRELGLMGPSVQKLFDEIGVLEYASFPISE